jgi:AcrR family transcriptional regulator
MPIPRRSSRRRRTQAERSATTRARLCDATIDCIVARGYAAASTVEVCRRARVSRGAQVHHFPTKQALVAAAIEQLFDRRHQEFRRGLAQSRDLNRAFAALWQLYSGPTLVAWIELLVASREEPALRARLQAVDARFFAAAQETCGELLGDRALTPAERAALTRLLLSTLDGLALHQMLVAEASPPPPALFLLRRLVAGLRRKR